MSRLLRPGAAGLVLIVVALPLVGLGGGLGGGLGVGRSAFAATGRSAFAATGSSDRIELLSQPAWVGSGGTYRLHFQITAHDPTNERVEVDVYSRLTTRTGFDSSLSGRMSGSLRYSTIQRISDLPSDGSGGVYIGIPVNRAAPANEPYEFTTGSNSAVYPVQVRLTQDGSTQGQPLTTYLVYSAGSSAATGLPRLAVSLTLPFSAGSADALSPAASSRLADLATALDATAVPLTLAVTPQTLDALAHGNRTDQATLATLDQAVARGDQVLPATYTPVSIGSLESAGLDHELDLQFEAGSATLNARLHVVPGTRTWVEDAPMGNVTLDAAVARGATQLILPDGDLTALPEAYQRTTFARASNVVTTSGAKLSAVTVDPALTAHFTQPGSQVLAANQLLAELAMIQLETPGETRGVALVPPTGWNENSGFLTTLLTGLSGNPLLAPVAADGLFTTLGASSGSTGSSGPPTRALSAPRAAANPLSDPGAIRQTRAAIQGYSSILPNQQAAAARMARQLLVAEAADVDDSRRSSMLGSLRGAVTAIERRIALPGSSSITLTARQGQVPLTVLLSDPSLHPHVVLRLTSQKLSFRRFAPGGVSCIPSGPTSEACALVLSGPATTLKVPVETRTSGVFPVDVSLESPDGSLVLATNHDTVRSTAVSGVGIVLIVGAAVFLAAWWIRDLRHGRRARRLVPPPSDDEDQPDLTASPETAASVLPPQPPSRSAPLLRPAVPDAAIEEFFATPPPDLPVTIGGERGSKDPTQTSVPRRP